jgi:hypothetical protein
MGTLDRIIRLVIGLMILGLFGALEPPLRHHTLGGLTPLGTALLGSGPMSALLGPSTRAPGPATASP